ncbi:DUF418 domain-containing protein [Psychroserpens sp.]|uniref:DUF418 domain-containing protein n=1 Tax=Psychroserpens sp. TaxID=2020870 RepID=UPI001B244419|nr:DUF418 domain-containing protein [Psychroserpens sp.]MBO6607645.1 DUF418 domain-containing protein [Psychroserpens sp.]MBO6630848.1 DUF418 domain-containing protein [Psychroserpens sp.]MBO6655043.1 DUF418 domain-containing protein [Psychroserpens sp.]MBO6683152.1 DUF418 domain-containing protein [Psychroserpens sp.]MBO6749669.1 DUF418 domain-containing protein [Psychroserpens sp.]
MTNIQPTSGTERLQVIDALRGFALFGILFANLYSFIGYNTYTTEEIVALPLSDRAMLFFIDWFIEGKFYSIFSILFGVGFALQAERFQHKGGNFSAYWFRRMLVLCCIGLIHMYCVWNGDILTLYSLLGLLLPLFAGLSNKVLLRWILVLLVCPIVMHAVLYLTPESSFWGSLSRISSDLKSEWGYSDLSLLEMRTSEQASEVFAINVLSAIPRAMSYLMFGRYFHVLGLFLIGILLARIWLPKIRNKNITVSKTIIWFGIIGLIINFGYAFIKSNHGWPSGFSDIGFFMGVVYHSGATIFALAICMLILKFWSTGKAQSVFKNLAILGRMALSNYIFQNVTAVLIFFGYGFALMRDVAFSSLPLFAFGILLVQWLFSRIWLSKYKQGPLEAIWKKLTYRNDKST